MCDETNNDWNGGERREKSAREGGSQRKRRNLKLLRGSERELKLDMAAATSYGERVDGRSPVTTPNNIKIETRNRFRSLRSKPVDVEERTHELQLDTSISTVKEDSIARSPGSLSLKEREIFHDTFSFLIKLGSSDKERNCRRQMSREETRWQNELKDLIWLELQAHHADRSPVAQDEYLCRQREAVGALLNEIIEYRFDPTASASENGSISVASNDSDIEQGVCPSCLSMYCRTCARARIDASKQVEGLLVRLEAAEDLYPSSHAFAAHYPLYGNPKFIGRVKAMCLWYNMTKHHRLKLLILGKLLMPLYAKKGHDETTDSGISLRSSDAADSLQSRRTLVRFELSKRDDDDDDENASPTDSNSSDSSSLGGFSFGHSCPSVEDEKLERLDFYLMEFDRHAYRKYIESVLKTRGLRRSLNFLERLHISILRKARLALERHDESDEDSGTSEEYEGDRELKRYGVWSPEARELNLPSYRSAFVFLSRVPLDVVHEFLRMRLEQKPQQPSAMSVRQLMRELREGLRIACVHRDRFAAHSRAALADDDKATYDTLFLEDIREFDESLRAVFEVYLDYLEQWVGMARHDGLNRSSIESEWTFVKSIAGDIGNTGDGRKVAATRFCKIACTMLVQIREFLISRPREIAQSIAPKQRNSERPTKSQLMSVGRELQGMFVEAREKVIRCVAFARCLRRDIEGSSIASDELTESIIALKETAMDLRREITLAIENFQNDIDRAEEPVVESDRASLRTRIREILHHAYKMGFDYHRELCRLFLAEERAVLVRSLVSFALLWMDFVRNRCERGRGLRPRWASQGLEYLMTVCEPLNTKHLTDQEFEELKASMDRCISHVVGTASPVSDFDVEGSRRLPRSRGASPIRPRTGTPSASLRQKCQDSPESPDSSTIPRKCVSPATMDESVAVSLTVPERMLPKHQRVALAIEKLDRCIDERLRSCELVGQVADSKAVDRVRIKSKRVTFTWQRGIKIGQGRFGKVYTVVNNRTGELLAMKEVQLQPGDHRAIRRVAEELQIFEGIQHEHLVRYYGIEIHREEMLIFMEFCAEGTLESLVAGSGNGLPELSVRRYTRQLLQAVSVLHSHGIVHRDIKPANIFLTDGGNYLKLGDFGSAVQIKAHTTMPGELQGFVGTQAYMAPEVFMKTNNEGHGRAVDIWSVGCCVVEMSSGRRPWAEYDSNYQIMFKVGMGESPASPKNLSPEGVDFLEKCFQHDPKKRATASSHLSHAFAQVYEDVNADLPLRS